MFTITSGFMFTFDPSSPFPSRVGWRDGGQGMERSRNGRAGGGIDGQMMNLCTPFRRPNDGSLPSAYAFLNDGDDKSLSSHRRLKKKSEYLLARELVR